MEAVNGNATENMSALKDVTLETANIHEETFEQRRNENAAAYKPIRRTSGIFGSSKAHRLQTSKKVRTECTADEPDSYKANRGRHE